METHYSATCHLWKDHHSELQSDFSWVSLSCILSSALYFYFISCFLEILLLLRFAAFLISILRIQLDHWVYRDSLFYPLFFPSWNRTSWVTDLLTPNEVHSTKMQSAIDSNLIGHKPGKRNGHWNWNS